LGQRNLHPDISLLHARGNSASAGAAGEFNTVMPWTMYSGMTDEDLSAISEYLRMAPPVKNVVERLFQRGQTDSHL
jgi:hypothetical protein